MPVVQQPPFQEATNDEATVAATQTTVEASDTVMAEDNVQHEVIAAPEVIAPSSMPYTMDQAYNKDDELVTVKWPLLMPPAAPGPQYDYHVERRP